MPRTVTKAYPDARMQRIAEWTAQMLDAAEQTARGESAHFIPRSISRCAFDLVRL